jgi:hypothetical protein
VPKVLREKLGEEGTEALIELLNGTAGQARTDVLTFVEEKFERRLSEEATKLDVKISEEVSKLDVKISEEVAKLETRITNEVAKLDVKISEEVAKLETRITNEATKLDVKISDIKADLVRWMFIFWVGQLGAIIGILFAFFRK